MKKAEWDQVIRDELDPALELDESTVKVTKFLLRESETHDMFSRGRCGLCQRHCAKTSQVNVVRDENGSVNPSEFCVDMAKERTTRVCLACLDQFRLHNVKILTCCLCGVSSAIFGHRTAPHMNQVYLAGTEKFVQVCDGCQNLHPQAFPECECCTNKSVLYVTHRNNSGVRICLECVHGNRTNAREFVLGKLEDLRMEEADLERKLENVEADEMELAE